MSDYVVLGDAPANTSKKVLEILSCSKCGKLEQCYNNSDGCIIYLDFEIGPHKQIFNFKGEELFFE